MEKTIYRIFVFAELVFAVIALLLLFNDAAKITIVSRVFKADFYELTFGYKKNGWKYLDFSIGNLISMILVYLSVIFLFVVAGIMLFFTKQFIVVNSNWDATIKTTGTPVTAGIFLIVAGVLIVVKDIVLYMIKNRVFSGFSRRSKVKKVKGRK